jgi:hypothetical protein
MFFSYPEIFLYFSIYYALHGIYLFLTPTKRTKFVKKEVSKCH